MLYVITLTYTRPMTDIEARLESHREWLGRYARSGNIIVAGPLESGLGGVVIARCPDQETLDAMIRDDSFHIHQLVRYDTQAFSPALRAAAFPSEWSVQAKSV